MLKKMYIDSPDEYEKELLHLSENSEIGILELSDIIENLYDNKPDRNSRIYKKWRNLINKLIDRVNENFGKTYSRIK